MNFVEEKMHLVLAQEAKTHRWFMGLKCEDKTVVLAYFRDREAARIFIHYYQEIVDGPEEEPDKMEIGPFCPKGLVS